MRSLPRPRRADGTRFELLSFDFAEKKARWRRVLDGVGVVAYGTNRRLLVAEQRGRDATVSIVAADTGAPLFRANLPTTELIPVRRPHYAARHMATTGTGRWFAVAPAYAPPSGLRRRSDVPQRRYGHGRGN